MFESKQDSQPFAYIMIVEPDDAVRDSILRTVEAPNCAVDVARDVDEAVMKASQHRPQLIIVKQHDPLYVDALQPPSVSIASQICRRARLSRAVRLVTHSDASITIKCRNRLPLPETFSQPNQCIIVRPLFKTQLWRKEWYSYSAHDMVLRLVSDYLPFWLGNKQHLPAHIPYIMFPGSYLKPWVWSDIECRTLIGLN
jgi:hypothetical protein